MCEKYKKEAQEINKERTNQLKDQIVIFNLSESFADPSRLTGVKLKNNPIPNIQKIKKDNTSGIMLSSNYGGGTANIEFMTLTGLATCNFTSTLQVPYTQLVGKMKTVPSIVQQFPEAVAIHPYKGTFYNRKTVYKKLGIDRYYFLGSEYKIINQKKNENSKYLSDETAYDNALKQINNSNKSGLFINLVTMQNHSPYNKNVYKNADKFNASGSIFDSATQINLNNYACGLNYTDEAAQKFMKELDKIEKPVTWVFYGDHLPGIYNFLSSDMGKYGLELHETDYFIYSNKYAQEHLGAKRLTTYTNYVSPNEFSAMVAEQTNSKVTPFLALLTHVYQELPATAIPFVLNDDENSEPVMVNQDGKIITNSDLTAKQKELWHDYKLIQYDLTVGKQYSVKYLMYK
nr:LTA synthase family protein [uncultured Ligilactobacillus sp.]